MSRIILWSSAVLLFAALSNIAIAGDCYVIGDTSKSKSWKPLGSRQNPYGTLAGVQGDTTCEVITVLYSDSALDGGIVLRDGQKLEGKKGPGGQLPVITNSSLPPLGYGVFLARDNQLKHLHILDTQNSAIAGGFGVQPFGGDLVIQNILVTGANQSEEIILPAARIFAPSILLGATADIDITIKNSEIGEAKVSSILIYQLDGFADIRINNTTVRDQGEVSEDYEVSPGIAVTATGSSSVDLAVINTTVHNIGGEVFSNSDGLLLLNQGSGAMTVKVDGYRYSNPDQGGYSGTSTGIEMGFFRSTGGGSFHGVVSNSVIEDAFYTGIQVLDQDSGGGNTLIADLHDNQISGTWDGIVAFTDATPLSSMSVDITGNTISPSNPFGCNCSYGISASAGSGSTNVFDARIEANTVSNTQGVGLAFTRIGSVNSVQLDAGLGGLGSAGLNRIIGTVGADILSFGMPVSAANNWWGSANGPASVIELNGGTVDVDPFLISDPN
jgi:hypothetical protein